jgi:hypothetical protein
VRVSPLPVLTAIFVFFFLVMLVFYMHDIDFVGRNEIFHLSFLGLFFTILNWFYSIVKESVLGFHTTKVQLGLRMGMLLFIASEVMFFFAFFWAFFHYSLSPSIAIGMV